MTGGVVGNGGGPQSTTHGLEVARGNILGSAPFGSFGEFVATGQVSNRIIWPNGIYRIPPSAGTAINIVSSSTDDDLGGSGVTEIEMHYLDINLEPQSAIIEMDGTTPIVGAVTGVRFIQCMHVQTTGTDYQGAAGEIRAYLGAQNYAVIAAGSTRCASSARMVPKGKRVFVQGLVGASISGTAAAGAIISVVATELDNHQYVDQGLFIPFGSIGAQDGSEAFNLPIPVPFNEGTVIAMTATVDKAATITGDWFGWQEDA